MRRASVVIIVINSVVTNIVDPIEFLFDGPKSGFFADIWRASVSGEVLRWSCVFDNISMTRFICMCCDFQLAR